MKFFKPTILALVLTIMLSSTAAAGNIGMRSAGNIGMRSNGNIGMRNAGNIGMRGAGSNATQSPTPITDPTAFRFDLESAITGSFAGLIRMLLESGALL